MIHPENSEEYQGLTVNGGVEQPAQVNPYLNRQRFARRQMTVSDYVEGILRDGAERARAIAAPTLAAARRAVGLP